MDNKTEKIGFMLYLCRRDSCIVNPTETTCQELWIKHLAELLGHCFSS